jgi:hypothetical protein
MFFQYQDYQLLFEAGIYWHPRPFYSLQITTAELIFGHFIMLVFYVGDAVGQEVRTIAIKLF